MPEDPQFIDIGRIVAPWGVKGDARAEAMTDFPDRFATGAELYIDGHPFTIERSHWHKGKVIIKLATIDSIEAAQRLKGRLLQIPLSRLHPLPPGECYQFQVIGLEVWTTEGELLGRVADILPTGSNDVFVVPSHDGEQLIPAIDDVVKSIDLEQGRITIEAIDGLLQRKG